MYILANGVSPRSEQLLMSCLNIKYVDSFILWLKFSQPVESLCILSPAGYTEDLYYCIYLKDFCLQCCPSE